jgi:chromosome segregation ATPase
VQSVPLADLLAKLEASESGRMNASLAASTPVVKRLMSERDRYRAQVAVKEAEVNSLLATMPRRIEQATHDANKRVAELEKLQAVLHTEVAKGNQERVEFEAAFTALEQELTKKAQETARLLQALASAFGEDVPSVAKAEAILGQRRPSE